MKKSFKLGLQEMGWWTGAFYAVAAVGGVAGGWLAGKLLTKGWSLNAARKVSLLLCALAVVPVFLAPYASQIWLAVLIVGLAGSAHQGWSANLFSVVSDTMPKEAISSVIGLGGFLAYFTGGFVNKITGHILRFKECTRPGYRHLYDLDQGRGKPGENMFYGLDAWGEPQFKSDPEHAAVFVFVREGVREVSALPCKGGADSPNGKVWWLNKPGWPRKPSLKDVVYKPKTEPTTAP